MKPRRSALVLSGTLAAGVAVASVLAAAPAQAETQTHKDKKGDVTLLQGRKPDLKTLDITKYENDYGDGALTLNTTVVALAEKGWALEYGVKGGGSFSGGEVRGTAGGLQSIWVDGDGNECEGAVATTEGDTVTFVIPVECVGNATSVKVVNYTFKNKGKSHILVDDANRGKLTQKDGPKYGDALAYTPPI